MGVAGSPPELQLAADCAIIADSACDTRTMDLGTQTKLSGVLRHAGTEDNETVQVTWGDGTAPSFQNLGPNLIANVMREPIGVVSIDVSSPAVPTVG